MEEGQKQYNKPKKSALQVLIKPIIFGFIVAASFLVLYAYAWYNQPTSSSTISELPNDEILGKLSIISGSTPFPEGTITKTYNPIQWSSPLPQTTSIHII